MSILIDICKRVNRMEERKKLIIDLFDHDRWKLITRKQHNKYNTYYIAHGMRKCRVYNSNIICSISKEQYDEKLRFLIDQKYYNITHINDFTVPSSLVCQIELF